MKIQLDLDNKKIRVEEETNLNEFFKAIKKLLPNDEWKQFTFDPTVINNWTNPIIIKEYPNYPSSPIQPWPMSPPWWITCGTTTSNDLVPQSGVFNVQC